MLKALIKPLIPKVLWLAARDRYQAMRHARKHRSAWLNRKNTPKDNHVQVYWDTLNHPNRPALVKQILACGDFESGSPVTIMEYGCHVGVNLLLLQQTLGRTDINYYAVEPNDAAVASLREKMPFVHVLHGEDRRFLTESAFPPVPVDISFVNAVFYCVESGRAKKVLEKLARVSASIVIGDELDNLNGTSTQYCIDRHTLLHPYATWLREFGFTKFTQVSAPEPKTAINGFLVARK